MLLYLNGGHDRVLEDAQIDWNDQKNLFAVN